MVFLLALPSVPPLWRYSFLASLSSFTVGIKNTVGFLWRVGMLLGLAKSGAGLFT